MPSKLLETFKKIFTNVQTNELTIVSNLMNLTVLVIISLGMVQSLLAPIRLRQQLKDSVLAT
jgi:hypothetical protein